MERGIRVVCFPLFSLNHHKMIPISWLSNKDPLYNTKNFITSKTDKYLLLPVSFQRNSFAEANQLCVHRKGSSVELSETPVQISLKYHRHFWSHHILIAWVNSWLYFLWQSHWSLGLIFLGLCGTFQCQESCG